MQVDLPLNSIPHESGVYLLHFTQPITGWHTTQHYIGWGEYLDRRIYEQILGGSAAARLCQVARERGIGVLIARIWPGETTDFERRLKDRHESPTLCPICKGRERGFQLVLPGFREQARRRGR